MKLNIRFQHWVLGTTIAIVLSLTLVFLLTVLGKFRHLTEENAKQRFETVAQQATSQLLNLVGGVGKFVTTQSHANPSLFVDSHQRINPDGVISAFISSLAVDDNLYGHFFALQNNEFVQAIAIRNHPQELTALKAPAGTWFGIRRITQEDNRRVERWEFLGSERQLLGRSEAMATYSPTQRPWFISANQQQKLIITDPYVFASTGDLGITISQPLLHKNGVLGSDINLATLQKFIAELPLSNNAAILMLDSQNRVIAHSVRGQLLENFSLSALTKLEQLTHPAFSRLNQVPLQEQAKLIQLPLDGNTQQSFVVIRQRAQAFPGAEFQVLMLAPVSDFIGPIEKAHGDILLISVLVLLVLVPLAILGSRRVVKALVLLASNSERIKSLDFSEDPKTSDSFLYEINALNDAQKVMHHSIKQKTKELNQAQEKLAQLVRNGLLLAKEHDREKLLSHILHGGRELANCAAATLYLKTERNTLRFAMRTNADKLPDFEVPLYHPDTGAPMTGYVSSYVALHNETVVIDDVYSETRFDLSGTKRFSEESGFRTISMLTVPLSPRDGEVIGVIQLMNAVDPLSGEIVPFPPEMVTFVEALAAQSAVALENHQLVEAQKVLMDSMIKIIAGAIDAKSAYTGGHCARVPELAVMLAEEACQVQQGALAEFAFRNEDEWREFRIGAWLHDCGKVTTPEYVVDKATKLETIYNRIHEIRTRFEVLWRDAEIARLQAILAGQPVADADAALAMRQQQLQDDFAFIAECNIGGEFMAAEKIDRVKAIAQQTWWRHFDDRLGLSHEELRRYEAHPPASLPAIEKLLDDKPWHILPRVDWRAFDEKYGFEIKVPQHLYHFGEVYNLSIARGTLTEEERFKINEHIIQTIVMLENMPFPKHLKRVPEYAGTHHETLIGTGYPRKLKAEQLSVPARIMAIADIFEALTASDRPYKKAKTLSESIKILSFFKKDQHIDGELFDLFLTSGVYRRYAERFLKPEQIDEVDITPYLTPRQ